MMGGHPLTVSLAAPLLDKLDLTGLFHKLLKDDFLALDYHEGLSLEKGALLSIDKVKKESPECVKLFLLLSQLPSGALE